MEFDLKAILKYILSRGFLLLLVFYLIYPQALNVGGSSFISGAGVIGMLVYALHRFPFKKDVLAVLAVFGCYVAVVLYSGYMNGRSDPTVISFVRSQMGWFFTAYLIIFFMFRIHKKPSFDTVAIYIVAAIALQSICTLLIYFNESIAEFLFSLQLQVDLNQEKTDSVKDERLVGYGTAFFGAGIAAGYGLMFLMYLVIKQKMNFLKVLFSGLTFVLIFYVGLFTARTAVIGLAVSLVIFAILFLLYKQPSRYQAFKFIGIIGGFMSIGATLAFIYFPDFTDWAFEMFYNYMSHGHAQTASSNGLIFLIYAPEDFHTFLFGTGSFDFFGPDVGYTRLMFYIGVPGMLMYFAYTMFLAKKAWNKDWTINLMLLALFVYNLIMNVKGFTDSNMLFYLFFFYFMFYKYYYFYPKAYPLQKVNLKIHKENLNNSITDQ